MTEFCLNFMKMVNKMRLVQQIIEKLTLEVGAKIYFLTKIAILSEVKIGYSKVAGVYRFVGWSLI